MNIELKMNTGGMWVNCLATINKDYASHLHPGSLTAHAWDMKVEISNQGVVYALREESLVICSTDVAVRSLENIVSELLPVAQTKLKNQLFGQQDTVVLREFTGKTIGILADAEVEAGFFNAWTSLGEAIQVRAKDIERFSKYASPHTGEANDVLKYIKLNGYNPVVAQSRYAGALGIRYK